MNPFTTTQRRQLRDTAWASIRHGCTHGHSLPAHSDDPRLQQPGASFVTLTRHGELRGCIGSLEARRPLLEDVAENAFNAAFRDPRFLPVDRHECDQLDLHISVLSPTEPLHFRDEADLLRQLRPGIDGLVLSDGRHRGTFLPQVWEQLPDPQDFLTHLKRKAGLPAAHWSPRLKVERYTVEVIASD